MQSSQRQSFSTKREARAFGRNLRSTWDRETLGAWGEAILQRLFESVLWREASTVLSYVGARPGELSTQPLIERAIREGKQVLVPITQPAGRMTWSALTRWEALASTDLGLLEPPPADQRPATNTAGLCIVPGVLFREDGHRLGFGGGYYDRFLAGRSGPSVGLCPALCYGHLFPVAPHDVPVDWIVTESGVFRAKALNDG